MSPSLDLLGDRPARGARPQRPPGPAAAEMAVSCALQVPPRSLGRRVGPEAPKQASQGSSVAPALPRTEDRTSTPVLQPLPALSPGSRTLAHPLTGPLYRTPRATPPTPISVTGCCPPVAQTGTLGVSPPLSSPAWSAPSTA